MVAFETIKHAKHISTSELHQDFVVDSNLGMRGPSFPIQN